MSVSRDAGCGIGHDLEWKSDVFLLVTLIVLHVVRVGESEHWVGRAASHNHVFGHGRQWVMLKGNRGVGANTGHWSSNGCWEFWKLSVLVRLVSCTDHVFWCGLRLHAQGCLVLLRGVDGRVVWAQLVL